MKTASPILPKATQVHLKVLFKIIIFIIIIVLMMFIFIMIMINLTICFREEPTIAYSQKGL